MKRVLIILLLFAGCVEPFEFTRNNLDPQLVVEAYVSDMSYNETLEAPSNGRYFTVKLKYSQTVDRRIQSRITPFAEVILIDDLDNEWTYYENPNEWGTYILFDQNFEACPERMYKLQITTRDKIISKDEFTYESDWQSLPPTTASPVEKIGFEEDEVRTYYYPAGKEKIREEKIIRVSTNIPSNPDGQVRYYRWQYAATWVYRAPLPNGPFPDVPSITPGQDVCWIENPQYLKEYTVEEDVVGDKKRELFTIDIEDNNRIYDNFSVLVYQQNLTKDYFFFNKLMQDQSKPNGIFDTPPANLPSNFTCVTDPEKQPLGYFGVVSETARRWYFSIHDLSYFVENDIYRVCTTRVNRPEDPPDYAPECVSCMFYTKGEPTLQRPTWWKDN